jgi:hypothetical protein
LYCHHQIVISGDTLQHAIRDVDSFKSVIGIQMDSERVAVDLSERDAQFKQLAQGIDGSCSISMKQVAQSRMTVVRLKWSRQSSVPVPSDWHSKRSSLVACITADGFCMKPFVTVDRSTAENELKYYGDDESNVSLTPR